MAIDFPSSPSTGSLSLQTPGLYVYDGTAWTQNTAANSPDIFTTNSFLYRTIYTRGYVSNGYIGGTPWKNVNRTVHTTDTTTNLGDMHNNTGSYLDGGWSDYYHYVYNASGGVGASSTNVSAMNMASESSRTHLNSWDLKTSRANCGALMNPSLSAAYITAGNSSTTDKHNYATETMYSLGSAANSPSAGGTSGGVSRFFGATKGWVWANGGGGYLSWTTETWTSGGLTLSTDGQPKGLSSKLGWAYCTQGSYGGANYYYKINDDTGANLATAISRPDTCGEENQQVGQYWGYTLGSYNGNQTNNTQKTMYLTDTVYAMGAACQPSGHSGMSSGAVGSASALILGGS